MNTYRLLPIKPFFFLYVCLESVGSLCWKAAAALLSPPASRTPAGVPFGAAGCLTPMAGSRLQNGSFQKSAASSTGPKIRQRPTLLPPATALALLWDDRPCRRPRFIGPPFFPGRSRRRSASGEAFLKEIPTTGEDFQCPRPPPEKHHEHRFAQHPLSKIQGGADVRLLGGYLRQE